MSCSRCVLIWTFESLLGCFLAKHIAGEVFSHSHASDSTPEGMSDAETPPAATSPSFLETPAARDDSVPASPVAIPGGAPRWRQQPPSASGIALDASSPSCGSWQLVHELSLSLQSLHDLKQYDAGSPGSGSNLSGDQHDSGCRERRNSTRSTLSEASGGSDWMPSALNLASDNFSLNIDVAAEPLPEAHDVPLPIASAAAVLDNAAGSLLPEGEGLAHGCDVVLPFEPHTIKQQATVAGLAVDPGLVCSLPDNAASSIAVMFPAECTAMGVLDDAAEERTALKELAAVTMRQAEESGQTEVQNVVKEDSRAQRLHAIRDRFLPQYKRCATVFDTGHGFVNWLRNLTRKSPGPPGVGITAAI